MSNGHGGSFCAINSDLSYGNECREERATFQERCALGLRQALRGYRFEVGGEPAAVGGALRLRLDVEDPDVGDRRSEVRPKGTMLGRQRPEVGGQGGTTCSV